MLILSLRLLLLLDLIVYLLRDNHVQTSVFPTTFIGLQKKKRESIGKSPWLWMATNEAIFLSCQCSAVINQWSTDLARCNPLQSVFFPQPLLPAASCQLTSHSVPCWVACSGNEILGILSLFKYLSLKCIFNIFFLVFFSVYLKYI